MFCLNNEMENIKMDTEKTQKNTNNGNSILEYEPHESISKYSNLIDADPTEVKDTILYTNQPKQIESKSFHENNNALNSFSSQKEFPEPCRENSNNDVKLKKIPKVLSKLCLGPGDDESVFEPITSSTTKHAEDNKLFDSSRESPGIENQKEKRKNNGNKIGDNVNCCNQPILSKEEAKYSLLTENEGSNYLFLGKEKPNRIEEQLDCDIDIPNKESENKNGKFSGSKFTLTRTPKVIKKIFLTNTDETMGPKEDVLYKEKNIRSGRSPIRMSDHSDIDEGVELRKKPHKKLKRSLRESFRRSFRVKRTQSEPPKEKCFEIKPRRSNTFKIFSRALLQTAAMKLPPPAPLLVEDPPSSEDVSDLEDVKHLADPALLNGSSGNFGSAGARSAPSTPQGVLCTSPGGLTEPLSQPCSPGCTSPSIQRSPSHSVFTKCEKASLKHLSTSTPVMTAQAQLTEPPSPKAAKDPKVHTTSKARQKKFLRHFPNVEDDEKVLNHYSCALIGDILLQGHLYITKNYFAFYSNVFGYVTKLLIPILSVENITKEKTARIIPNAVGIATSEDKHVFGSLMSRDNTLQYMRTVWQKAKSASPVIIEPEIIEQDLDSSESGEGESGRDSPPPEIKPRFSLVKKIEKEALPNQTEGLLYERKGSKGLIVTLKDTISEFRKLPRQSLILFATTLLLILLFLSAAVLLYRISKIQNKYSLALQDNVVVSGSEDIYSDLLQWQSQLHSKSAGAVHSFLDSNLDQIAKVRQSLEALSSLLIQNSNPLAQDSNAKPLETTKDAS